MFRWKHGGSHSHSNQTEDEQQHEAKVDELRSAIGGSLSPRASKYCTEACLRRYLEARNWNVAKAARMLQDSLKWRETYQPEEIRWPEVSVEQETGKMYRANFQDREGRTVIVMTPARQNTTSHEGQLRHLVYLLENAIINLPAGQAQITWLIDFTGWSLKNSVPIKTAQETASILQNHYPERLAIAFLFNPPRVFEIFWKVVKLFLDPKTFQKVNFVYPKNGESVTVMHRFFDPAVLPAEFGGKSSVVYNHEEFGSMMAKDDITTAAFWGTGGQQPMQHSSSGDAMPDPPEESSVAARAS